MRLAFVGLVSEIFGSFLCVFLDFVSGFEVVFGNFWLICISFFFFLVGSFIRRLGRVIGFLGF